MCQICSAIETGKEKETQQEIHLCKVKRWCAESCRHWALIQGDLFITLWHPGSPRFTTQPELTKWIHFLSSLIRQGGTLPHPDPYPVPFPVSPDPGQIQALVITLLKHTVNQICPISVREGKGRKAERPHGSSASPLGDLGCVWSTQEELPGPCSLFLSSTALT